MRNPRHTHAEAGAALRRRPSAARPRGERPGTGRARRSELQGIGTMPRSSAKRARAAKPAEAERDDKYFSKVIGKAFDILRLLRAAPQPLSLNELTLRVGLAKSSVFRMLHT